MPKSNLLLCFDAFGTLFKPKLPVPQQYSEVARRCGLGGFSDEQLQSSFRTAFKSLAKAYPNYGRSAGMGATRWWTHVCVPSKPNSGGLPPTTSRRDSRCPHTVPANRTEKVIQQTFQPLLPPGQQLPEELAPKLLHRFSSREGYAMDSQLLSWLRALKRSHHHPGGSHDGVIIGVITNSDDRVPEILSSFGLSVSPRRYGSPAERKMADGRHDIDFHCMSYEVGFEKPDRRIFDAADELAREFFAAGSGEESAGSRDGPAPWIKVYVGDEGGGGGGGARGAGGSAVLIDSEEQHPQIPKLGGPDAGAVDVVFTPGTALRVANIGELVEWLTGYTSSEEKS